MNARRFSTVVSVALLTSVQHIFALTEIADDITWFYTVSNGQASVSKASVNGWDLYSTHAPRYVSFPSQISIPSTLGGSPVTSIDSGSFSRCGFSSVTIPNSVTNIGDGAFRGCSSLSFLTIPDSVKSIGKWAFAGCSELGKYCWQGFVIPDSVTSIGDGAFEDCQALRKVTISKGVTRIKKRTFAGCRELGFLTIPDSVTSIDEEAFRGCNLRYCNLEIPKSVTSIGENAFHLSGLRSVTICGGGKYISIHPSAFSDCNLESVPKSGYYQVGSQHPDKLSPEEEIKAAEDGMKALAALMGILGTAAQIDQEERAKREAQREAEAAFRAQDSYGRLYDDNGNESRMQRQLAEQQRQIQQLQEQQQQGQNRQWPQREGRVVECHVCRGTGFISWKPGSPPCQECGATGYIRK